ncbi:MAG TPA: hypothetical protein VGI58_20220 [Streptosporangiaceae bacterium]
MTRPNGIDPRYAALFASALQRSDMPTPEMVTEAISAMLTRLGKDGCASKMAQEFGDHPEEACERMRWARYLTDELAAEIADELARHAPGTDPPAEPLSRPAA